MALNIGQIDGFDRWSNQFISPLVKSMDLTIGQINGFDRWSKL
jgi:hypothetical protein